jgi:hypothetical protein
MNIWIYTYVEIGSQYHAFIWNAIYSIKVRCCMYGFACNRCGFIVINVSEVIQASLFYLLIRTIHSLCYALYSQCYWQYLKKCKLNLKSYQGSLLTVRKSRIFLTFRLFGIKIGYSEYLQSPLHNVIVIRGLCDLEGLNYCGVMWRTRRQYSPPKGW